MEAIAIRLEAITTSKKKLLVAIGEQLVCLDEGESHSSTDDHCE